MTTALEKKPSEIARKPWWTLPEDVHRLLDRRMHWRGLRPFREWVSETEEWLPEIDMLRKDGNLVIRADVSGIKPEDLEVTVEGDLLTIKGHREEEKEVKEEEYYCSERARGEFTRTGRLPEAVQADQVEARRDNGVLEVTIPAPKTAESAAVKIPIK